jgi:hypothetical protein
MLRQIRQRGQKAHAEASCIVKAQFKIGAELEDHMIVWRIVLGRRACPETASHAEVQQQHVVWMEMHEEIFGASLNPLDGTAYSVFLQGRRIDEMPQPRLPHPYAGNLLTD